MTGVVIEERTHDYMASIENEPEKWESGRSEDEVLASLVIARSDLFNEEEIEKELDNWGSTGVNLNIVGREISLDLERFGVELKYKV